jgi:hypothetical protein
MPHRRAPPRRHPRFQAAKYASRCSLPWKDDCARPMPRGCSRCFSLKRAPLPVRPGRSCHMCQRRRWAVPAPVRCSAWRGACFQRPALGTRKPRRARSHSSATCRGPLQRVQQRSATRRGVSPSRRLPGRKARFRLCLCEPTCRCVRLRKCDGTWRWGLRQCSLQAWHSRTAGPSLEPTRHPGQTPRLTKPQANRRTEPRTWMQRGMVTSSLMPGWMRSDGRHC